MFKNNKLTNAVRFALIAGATSSALVMPNAFAAEETAEKTERIAVTGSRIAKPELSQATPIIVLGADDIAKFGTTDIASMLAELPAIGATDTLVGNNNSNQEAGVSSADLRRLGSNRTLVLVNGRRHVAGSPGSSQVDLSTIPSSLIKRVEIITGGASAIYGSDAVSGVVNVILKDDFEGFELDIQGSGSLEGVGTKNHSFNLLTGGNFADGKGNVTFFAGLDRRAEVLATDIRQYNNWGTIANPDDTGEEDGIPDRLRAQNVGSELISSTGVINAFGGAAGRYTFADDGTPQLQVNRSGENSFAFGSFPDGCEHCLFTEDYENYVPEVNKLTVASTLNYELTDNVQFVSDFKYVKSDIEQQFQPSFRFGDVEINIADNAFLDENLRQEFINAGQTSGTFAKFFDELGNRSADNTRELFRYTAAFQGDFQLSDTNFDFDIYYVYGETRNQRKTLNDLIPDNLDAAIDSVIDPATGLAACRSQVPSAQGDDYEDPASVNGSDCVAYNPFGLGEASAEAIDFVSADVTREDEITQEVYGASLVTDTSEFFSLQGGPVDIAIGFEYRKETSESTTDEFTKAGFLSNAATPDSYGEYDVSERFIEINVPVLADLDFAHELTFDAAYRFADYSHAGNAEAWKVGFLYAPIEDFRIRSTFGEAVRAPNISEAFDPQSPGFASINDPCDNDNINDDEDRVANCAALGIASGFEANDNVSIDLLSGGNPELESEESTSLTVGVVWVPNFIENFSVTVDYYKIEIENAISFIDAQDVIDNCVDATGGLDTAFCSQVDRDPITNDISLVRSGFLNAAALNTKGVEAQFNYKLALNEFDLPGTVNFNLLANKLLELEIFEFQDRPDEINVEEGEVGDPELQLRLSATYQLGDLSVSWASRYIDRSVTYDVSPDGGSPEDLAQGYVPSMTTHDLSARYNINDNVTINGGVRNIFDKLPPGYTANGIYDLEGRRAFIGLNIKL